MESFKCFENSTSYFTFDRNTCPNACSLTEYSLSVQESENLEYADFQHEAPEDFFERNLKWFVLQQGKDELISMVNINFESPRITHIIKDAKVTFSDILGNVGGTLGIFLGISIVSLVEELLVVWNFFKQLQVTKEELKKK